MNARTFRQLGSPLALALCLLTGCAAPEDAGSPAQISEAPLSANPSVTFSEFDGGTNQVTLGYGIVLNAGSQLTRKWLVAHDDRLPVAIPAPAGVTPLYSRERFSGAYEYAGSIPVRASEDVAAIELRVIVFDLWGDRVRTLSATYVEEISAGAERTFTPKWSLHSETEASEHLASLVFVARVRTADGRVLDADLGAIALKATELGGEIAPRDLVPEAIGDTIAAAVGE